MTTPSLPRPVVIDTDPGIDDALALMLAFCSPELHVKLITTVAGNVPVQVATSNVRRLLALINPPTWPPLAQGAAHPLHRPLYTATTVHGPDGLGGLTQYRRADGSPHYPLPHQPAVHRSAIHHLLHMVQTYGAELTIIALGPLTNIARAIHRAPETMRHVGRLIIMGGAIGVPGNVSPTAEFNIFVDPHAAAIVFASGLPITLVPLDVTHQVRLRREFLQQTIRDPGTRVARAVRQMTRHLLHGPQQSRGMALHDPLAVAVALDPSLVHLTSLPVEVETQRQQTLGMTIADRRAATCWPASSTPLDVALEVDASRVLELFTDRVLIGGTSAHRVAATTHLRGCRRKRQR